MKNNLQSEYEKSIPKDILQNRAIKDYMDCNISIFKKLKKVSFVEKFINERKIRKLSEKLIDELRPYKCTNPEELNSRQTDELKKIITSYILELDKKKLFFDMPFLKFFLDQGYLNVAEKFIAHAKKEDNKLTHQEIFQAIRNVWIMNSLQIYWGIPLEMTPSIYSYSMLYPYTDNLLDNPNIPIEEKYKFNLRLTRVLRGEKITPDNFSESRIFAHVENIESQFSRDAYPQVFQSIELIQEAQSESLKQNQEAKIDCKEILSLSFFKGGSSVLADAFLVKGNLTLEEMHFAFDYGAFLQLLDDLQDISSDKEDGYQTLFSILSENGIIDDGVNKLISFIFHVNEPLNNENKTMILMKKVISSCTLVMIMEAVGKHPEIISKKLYRKLESYSKVRLSFYNEFELQISSLVKEYNLSEVI